MNEEIMNEIQPVRPKDQFTFSCRQCGECCRNIEGCVMVESLDAYRLARYLRAKGEPIEGIEDFLFRYCEPEPLTEEGFPIYMLKTKAPNSSCIFLTDGRCSVYPARTRTCRIYPLTVGPGERGRDFEYCLCLDRHQSHFTGSRVSVKDWLYQNFKREDKEYVKREYWKHSPLPCRQAVYPYSPSLLQPSAGQWAVPEKPGTVHSEPALPQVSE